MPTQTGTQRVLYPTAYHFYASIICVIRSVFMARKKENDYFVIDLLLSYALPVDISKNIARSDRLSYRLMLPGHGA